MNVLSGKVVDGVIRVEGLDLAEGAVVTVLSAAEGEEVLLTEAEKRELIEQEVSRAVAILAMNPGLGVRIREGALNGVRRLQLPRIRCYLYYRVGADSLEVLAFWHTSLGYEPEGTGFFGL